MKIYILETWRTTASIFKLFRVHVYLPLCFLVAMLGLDIMGEPHDTLKLFYLGMSTTLTLIGAFSFNDAEDALEDALSKTPRNPVSLGEISRQTAYFVFILSSITGLLIAIFIGTITALIISTVLIITFIYSWRKIRLKSKPFWDVFAHILTFGLIFLASAWSTQAGIVFNRHVLNLALIFSIGGAIALLTHQLYEYRNDTIANIKTTVSILGIKRTYFTIGLLLFGLTSLLLIELRSDVLPWKPLLAMCGVAISILLLSVIIFPSRAAHVSKRIFPWAVSAGIIVSIVIWNFA